MEEPVETVEDLLVMGHGDDAGVLLGGELAQQVHDDARALAVQRGGRFVGEDDARAVGQRPGDGHALRLAARQQRRHGAGAVADLQIVQQFLRAGLRLCPALARQMQHQRDVVGGIEERQQVVGLEDEADLVEPQAAQVAAQPVAVEDRVRHPAQTCPPDGSMMQPMMFSSVVLPEPDGPSSATTSPAWTFRSTARSASTRVSPSP